MSNRCILPVLALLILNLMNGCQQPTPGGPGAVRTVADGIDYLGTWAINDSENQLFNIIVRPDRTVVSNWSKGSRGAWGERGTWKRVGSRMIIEYGDGWVDVLMPSRYGVARQSFRPGTNMDGVPTSVGSAMRVEDDIARYCGVFEVGEDASYIALLSSGLAYRSHLPESGLAGEVVPVRGTWTRKGTNVDLAWSDGSLQVIGWQRGVYVVEPRSTDSPRASESTRLLRPVDGLAFGGRLQ